MRYPITSASADGHPPSSMISNSMTHRILIDRICPGMWNAEASLFISIATVLAVFDIRLPDDEKSRERTRNVEYSTGMIRYVLTLDAYRLMLSWSIVIRVLLRSRLHPDLVQIWNCCDIVYVDVSYSGLGAHFYRCNMYRSIDRIVQLWSV